MTQPIQAVTRPRPDRLIGIKEAIHITGLARSTIYNHMERGIFPRPLAVTTQCIRWRESQIYEWIEKLPVAIVTPDPKRLVAAHIHPENRRKRILGYWKETVTYSISAQVKFHFA